ncbi:PqqD family protein, HPr-rel-A system [Saccharopolyspora kobensis]|uniref:PqqD family protein, HPr-rel-A system n=1 Tax=Saccharopolyspora kobensis TaxID=146035 RepID=A0A1H6EJ77_9PSEU|nr:lasso peptide biosynthesis PqqD family chaperone [Saccharopolyspora kobensis]SEG96915.1 PqqD family protein, HPr-rel-A system [Saccharopolyspora kobensis]SFE64685.1 PqqD family protein, HPr-rel-A system [Saccharopolyspora kobensis]
MTIRLRDHVSLTDAEDGSGVLLDERSGQYWHLNESGLRTLRMCLDGAEEPAIARALLPEADGDQEQAVRDVRAVIEELLRAGLVVR